MTTPVMELVDVHVVHKTRTGGLFRPGTVRAVDGVSFSISRGETVGIVGESGSGKTTMARVLVGLQPATSGQVLFKGEPLRYDAASRRKLGRAVSVVFQDPATALNPRMVVREQLLDPLNVHDVGEPGRRGERVRELLRLVGLPMSALDVLPRQISGGQRQRVAIARALALEPDVIIADEPTSALDVSVRAQVLNLLADLKEWRSRMREELKVPAYVVFTDNTLIAIAEALPTDDAALTAIPGIGTRKLEQFGADVLAMVKARARD